MDKKAAGALGGKKTAEKYGPEYMRKIGALGAAATWSKYELVPYRQNQFAMVDKSTGKIIAFHS